jgi:superfamily II DNA or RNA helicase
VAAPARDQLRNRHGYHPVTTDLAGVLATGLFDQLLVFGSGLPDVIDHVVEARLVTEPPVQLPQGIYWFDGIDPSLALLVSSGSPAAPSLSVPAEAVPPGSALDNALAWADQSWDGASAVPRPMFAVGSEVVVSGTGHDGIVRESRMYVGGGWNYRVFAGGSTSRCDEGAISARPMEDRASAWVDTKPVSPRRFSATLTRAKLTGRFTDTVFSFRATRTIFRPYQFKPVQKLLNTGTLRLLIADEVGLGKTIEAGLVWTEMEARRQANRVLVVCPSALVTKWKREMEERFGFNLVELNGDGLRDLLDRVESGRLPLRATYICSIERLRMWDGIERATELNLNFDLAIVDEAHSFRNSDTRSYELGEHLSTWAEAMVMLSATPVNLRNRDLFNLLSVLVPGEFEDLESLEERLAPNRVLSRITKSMLDSDATNIQRRAWLDELGSDVFGSILTLRPDYALLRELLAKDALEPTDAVQIKRICSELHGLSAEVTRTRKVEVQEFKAMREPHHVPALFNDSEAAFYDAYRGWCIERAAVTGSPLHFAMQMPLRLAGSCLPEAARSVLGWGRHKTVVDLEVDDGFEAKTASRDVAPGPELVRLARSLTTDTKFDQFQIAIEDLVRQGKRVLVFTHSRRTLRYLESRLRGDARVVALHGDVVRRKRDEIMAAFRGGAYDVLLATRVASEGLDFEFCSAVVNYDLPWNPMEVEQRIGRIDRIGQTEEKLAILNFHTPGTIESDIIERVMDRIGVFEHAIGELEPILDSGWKGVQDILFDFSLSPEQREQRSREAILALEEQARALAEVEAAAPTLVSSDGAEIEGLEQDLLASGRYVGQDELALLVQDWAETFSGQVEREAQVLRLRGNDEMAEHVQAVVRTHERLSTEVTELTTAFRSGMTMAYSLDQELSRVSGLPLLTATHPAVRAAVGTPGYRQGRYTLLRMTPAIAGVPGGQYLSLLAVADWDGIRELHEVWTATVDLASLSDAGPDVGLAVMKELARGTLVAGPLHDYGNLEEAVEMATFNLEVRIGERRRELMAENDAFVATRRQSFAQVHERRLRSLRVTLATHQERGNTRAIPLTEARIRKQERRFAEQLGKLDVTSQPQLKTQDLAVCVIEVNE